VSSSLILPLSYSSYLMLIGSERRQTKTFFKENNIHGKAKPASSYIFHTSLSFIIHSTQEILISTIIVQT